MGVVVPFPGKAARKTKRKSKPLKSYGFTIQFGSVLMGQTEAGALDDAFNIAQRMADVLARAGFEFTDPVMTWHGETE